MGGNLPERIDETERREADEDETRGFGVSLIGDDEVGISIGD
jgi:hypothetical protein